MIGGWGDILFISRAAGGCFFTCFVLLDTEEGKKGKGMDCYIYKQVKLGMRLDGRERRGANACEWVSSTRRLTGVLILVSSRRAQRIKLTPPPSETREKNLGLRCIMTTRSVSGYRGVGR